MNSMATVLNIEQMTLEERIRAMEELWQSLSRRQEDVPVPEWHKGLLDERRRLVESGEAQFVDWETAKQQITDETS